MVDFAVMLDKRQLCGGFLILAFILLSAVLQLRCCWFSFRVEHVLLVDGCMIEGGGLIDGTHDRGGHRLIQVIDLCCLLCASSHIVTASLVVDCRNAVWFLRLRRVFKVDVGIFRYWLYGALLTTY